MHANPKKKRMHQMASAATHKKHYFDLTPSSFTWDLQCNLHAEKRADTKIAFFALGLSDSRSWVRGRSDQLYWDVVLPPGYTLFVRLAFSLL